MDDPLSEVIALLQPRAVFSKRIAGAGRFRGGEGIVREIAFDAAATVSLMGERRRHRPWGLEGGGPGAAGEDWLLHRDGSRRRLPGKVTIEVEAGDRLLILTPGGGGWGTSSGG